MTRLLKSIMNDVAHGDCIDVMRALPWASVDFILTERASSASWTTVIC